MELLRVHVSAHSRLRLQYNLQQIRVGISFSSQRSYKDLRPKAQCISSYRNFQTSAPCLSTSHFTYSISAAFSGKGHRFNRDTNVYNFHPSTQFPPHSRDPSNAKAQKKQRPDSGQDAYFISKVGGSEAVAFGVADGVGGWVDSGIDSADFAHGFCGYMADSAYSVEERGKLKAKDLMMMGYEKIVADQTVTGGGSTACIGIAREDGSLEVANLGDSGFVQLRLNALHYSSNPQTHAFNTPYQLSIIPPRILAQAAAFGGAPLRDLPKDASVTNHQLRHGDVLVFATDGVWDNVSSQEILKTVSRHMTASKGWKASESGMVMSKKLGALTQQEDISKQGSYTLQSLLATAIVSEAKAASLNTKRDGPFAKEVQKHYPEENYHGGKVDDICVLVVIAVKNR
ncbi:MAG: hypothetical protein M1830_004189 [Pleopsidium flavum]|nr:MAG: hypothetical protein M1830_004189 [Pleopsidium flavum]